MPYGIEAYATPSQSVPAPQGPFFGVRVEKHDRYDILWFVWDKDGIIPKYLIREDWEPIIQYRHKDELVRVTLRYHYEWKDYSAPDLQDEPHFSLPLKVIFTGSTHGAIIRKLHDTMFDILLHSHKKLDPSYETIIHEENVPSFARRGLLNRKGIMVAVGQDIHERAQETLEEIDEMFG